MDYKKYDSVIFDVDGTLLDSLSIWQEIDREYLKKKGVECPDNLKDEISGMSVDEMAEYFRDRFGIDSTRGEILFDWFCLSYGKYVHHVEAKPGAEKYMQFLKDQGKTVGIATSNRPELVKDALNRQNLCSYVHSMAFTGGKIPGKPDPMVFHMASTHLETKPERCLVFEDSPNGVMAAKKAGMDVIAVSEDWSEEDKKYIEDNTLFVVDNFEDERIYQLI